MGNKSIKRNYIYNTTYQILVILAPIVTAPYISRILGADGVGVYSFYSSVVSYFALFASFSISIYGQRTISYCRDNRELRSEEFWNAKAFECITSMIAFVMYLLLLVFVPSSNKMIMMVFSINILSKLFDVNFVFSAMEEFGIITIRNIAIKALHIALIFLLIKRKEDLPIYVALASGAGFLSNIVMWLSLYRYVDKPNFKKLRPFRNFNTMLGLFIPVIAIQIYTVLDKTMLGLILRDSFESGYYEQAEKLPKVALSLLTSLNTVMVARIGYDYKRGDIETIRKRMNKSYNFVWFLGIPMCLGLIGVSNNLVRWFFGPGYEPVIPLLCISSFLILAIGINSVTGGQYLISTEREKLYTKTVCIGAVINLILNSILIPFWGASGAVIASVVAESSIAIIQLVCIRNELPIKEIIKPLPKYLIAGLIMLAIVLFLGYILEPSFINTMLIIVSGVAVYMLLLLLFKDSFLIDNSKIVLRFIMSIISRGDGNS